MTARTRRSTGPSCPPDALVAGVDDILDGLAVTLADEALNTAALEGDISVGVAAAHAVAAMASAQAATDLALEPLGLRATGSARGPEGCTAEVS